MGQLHGFITHIFWLLNFQQLAVNTVIISIIIIEYSGKSSTKMRLLGPAAGRIPHFPPCTSELGTVDRSSGELSITACGYQEPAFPASCRPAHKEKLDSVSQSVVHI